jgi:hypothetical protein
MEKPGTEYGSQTLKFVQTLKMVPAMIPIYTLHYDESDYSKIPSAHNLLLVETWEKNNAV